MMVLRGIGVLSCGKLLGTMYAAMGLILGGIMTLVSLVGAVAVQQERAGGDEAFVALFMGVGSVIILPIFYGVMGFVGGIISAAIYNFIAGVIGGLELDLQPTAIQS